MVVTKPKHLYTRIYIFFLVGPISEAILSNSVKILKNLQYSNGLFSASKPTVKTGYNAAWIRDCIYESLGFEATKSTKRLKKAYWALLDILKKHEYKVDWAIKEKPKYHFQYIHARYDPFTMEEYYDEWGNKQNDAIGALLFKIGDLELKGYKIIRDQSDLKAIIKLVDYLESIEYWHDKDNGMWEESEEIHASSVGACVAGLKNISKIVDVDPILIKKGEATLSWLLPNESESKPVDLALLSLIYPYDIVDKKTALQIVKNIETNLVRQKGVIRYIGDRYYSNGSEAEWTKGFPWLAIIYKHLNNPKKYAHYMRKTLEAMNQKGEMPELYYAGTAKHNENSPLGWSQALYIVSATI
ncbi:MAG: glycoside hydrolase family 15 [Nanoarchaeota archaeon]|nr:glycoside hydrolase family 15 [Nanoarchaeota archaeon]MBU1704240.1 glycoside hydrolase family 15 [Nanoarchaeota archaeon]